MTAEAREAGAPEDPAADGLRPLDIALLTYKGNPFCGGQGVYVRHLSRELARLGHRVEVIGAQPYPVLDEGYDGLSLTELPSLDLYRQPDPFRTPGRGEYRDWIDALEVATMWTGGFPEPLTFSLRARRHLRARRGEFDVVHDNQTLGYGLLGDVGAPLVTTIHHPITVDRQLELDAADGWKRRASVRRWYAFTRMQKRVARRLPSVLTVSGTSQQEIVDHLGVRRDRVHVVHIGADTDLFSPDPSVPVVPGRIVTTSSADVPLKGLVHLVEALAKVRTEHPGAHLVVVGKRPAEGPVAQAMERYGLAGAVEFVKGISDAELVDLVRSAQVACVPSLYEGFSLPAAEAMATGTPLLATTGGALPEVAGRDGETCLAVPPGDAGALAAGLGRLLGDADLRARLGAAGRERVLRHFTWARAAEGTVARYREAIARAGSDGDRATSAASGRPATGDARSATEDTRSARRVLGRSVSGDTRSVSGDTRSAHRVPGRSAPGETRSATGDARSTPGAVRSASGASDRRTAPTGAEPGGTGSATAAAVGGPAEADTPAATVASASVAPVAAAGAGSAAPTDVEGVNSESRATC
ncbi:glycosyltransferase family 4 protein [Streptomyces sp. 378]|uniref:glycosyltransferase family 4 protein n=1 Tax=Streptomyces sp. 378 TaxID=3049412 RepID=UPI0024C219EC|nr:glycosyltransferase family 4 protein [Streptomyces sp. 378]MDK1343825.1 glycosyltransferase family 4 protein [Streptomyces sp. 378]